MNDLSHGETLKSKSENIILTISEDNLAAYVTIRKNPDFIDENEILKLLKTANITHGYATAIQYNKKHKLQKEYDKPFLIALGSNPNAKPEITLLFDRSRCFDPNVSFNLFEMEQFVSVKKGEVLAEVSAILTEQTGKDIFGKSISKFSKEEPSIYNYLGKNVKFDEENSQLTALKAGYPYIDGSNRIQIKSDFYINEDLEDISLRLSGDLVVNGAIYNSHLEIDGDLMIYGEVEDCKDFGIIANGDISLDFAENSRIIANGQIKFHNEVNNCHLSATQGIWGEENSKVTASTLQSANSITLFSVGDEQPSLTEIEVSVCTFKKELIKKAQFELQKHSQSKSKKIQPDPSLISKIEAEIKNLENEYLKEIDSVLSMTPKRLKISIIKKTYPPVNIRILNHSDNIKTEKGRINFTLVDNELVINEVDRFTE
jgi:uncharacterized protein (DUF342 family)